MVELKLCKGDFDLNSLENRSEYSGFLRNALSWSGSVSPKVLRGVLASSAFCLAIRKLVEHYIDLSGDIAPFEYSGVVLGLLLVFRINSGYDRWWEARKIWGNVVNQSRNIALIGLSYNSAPEEWRKKWIGWVAVLPYVLKNTLRSESSEEVVSRLLGSEEATQLKKVMHSPSWVSFQIANLLNEARLKGWMDPFSFQRAERERALLMDAVGACERILKTPIPFVLVVKLKRFILLFLILLPFGLVLKLGYIAPLIDALIAYPLLSLDQIGYELQNPFQKDRLSHLPLDEICRNIEKTVFEIESSGKSAEAPRSGC